MSVRQVDAFVFRRTQIIDGTPVPTVSGLETSATANGAMDADDGFDQEEELAHVTTSALASDMGALAEADNMGTALIPIPIGATTSIPTVDSTYFQRVVASGATAFAESRHNEGVIQAPGSYVVEGQNGETQGFLNGFLYVAEGGGFVEAGESADVLMETVNLRAEIGGSQVNGAVRVNAEGEKTAIVTSNLFTLPNDGVVGSINHLYRFAIPIADGNSVIMRSNIGGGDSSATAFTSQPGDSATLQWSFKAMAWSYATTNLPNIPVNTAVRVFGDFSSNGVVDAADFTVWRDTFGSTTLLAADADGDGIVDDDDYLIWKLTFGTTVEASPGLVPSESSLVVPEPHGLIICILGVVAAKSACLRSCRQNP